jgi:hypothetical protein
LTKAPSHEELKQLKVFVNDNKDKIPGEMADVLNRLLGVYAGFLLSAQTAKNTLSRLREAMGLLPKSERGRGAGIVGNEAQASLATEELTPLQQELLAEMNKKKAEALSQARDYAKEIRRLKPKLQDPLQLGFALECEMMFSEPPGSRASRESKEKVEKMAEFGREKGLQSTFDYAKRVDLEILVTETEHKIETVTDPLSGKSVRASMADVGPEGFQLTWRAIANLVKLHVGFAIPINRLSALIGQPEFRSGKICRILEWVATKLLPIYLCLIESVADAEILFGDDTKTKVIELMEPKEESLAKSIDAMLGFAQAKKNGEGAKTGLNVSLLVGRTDKNDPRSAIRFFRTHMGSVGDLLSQALELRDPRLKKLIFQGDLSTTNLPSRELLSRFELTIAGCGAHARRPFWRYREDDGALCFYMLRGFAALARVEDLINAKGRNAETILKLRGRYARWIWLALRNRCIAAATGEILGRATYPSGVSLDVWPPGSELHIAARYVIKHFDELTQYLTNPYLHYTNNGIERALRIEKCMLSGSKFRKTRNGRAVLDVLRTINATCTAAQVDLTVYLRYVFKHLSELQENPKAFTPYAVAIKLER